MNPSLSKSCGVKCFSHSDDINEVSVQVVNLVVGHRNAMKGSQAA